MSLAIVDPANPYRYVGVQGRVVEITEQGADAHIDSLAKKYLGQDKYPFRERRRGAGDLQDRSGAQQRHGLSPPGAGRRHDGPTDQAPVAADARGRGELRSAEPC